MSLPIAPLPPLTLSSFPSKHWFYHSLLPTHTHTLTVAQQLQTADTNQIQLYQYKDIAPQLIRNIITTRTWLEKDAKKCGIKWTAVLPMIRHFETTSLNLAAFLAEDTECMEEIVQHIGEDDLQALLKEYLIEILDAKGKPRI